MAGGHFVLAGGEHTETYVEKTKVTVSSAYNQLLCEEIACRWAADRIAVVVGPAFVGIAIATLVAHELYNITHVDISTMFTETDGSGGQILKRNRELIAGGKSPDCR